MAIVPLVSALVHAGAYIHARHSEQQPDATGVEALWAPGVITAAACGYFVGLSPLISLACFWRTYCLRNQAQQLTNDGEGYDDDRLQDIVTAHARALGLLSIVALIPVGLTTQLGLAAIIYVCLSPNEQTYPTIGSDLSRVISNVTEIAGLAIIWGSDLCVPLMKSFMDFIGPKVPEQYGALPLFQRGLQVVNELNGTQPLASYCKLEENHPGNHIMRLLDSSGAALKKACGL